jgi:hypothetical protein
MLSQINWSLLDAMQLSYSLVRMESNSQRKSKPTSLSSSLSTLIALKSNFILEPYKVVKVVTSFFTAPLQSTCQKINFFKVSNCLYTILHMLRGASLVQPLRSLSPSLSPSPSLSLDLCRQSPEVLSLTCSQFSQTVELFQEIEIQRFRNCLLSFLYENTSAQRIKSDLTPIDSVLADEMRGWLTEHPKSRRGQSQNDKLFDRVEGMLLDLTGQINEVSSLLSVSVSLTLSHSLRYSLIRLLVSPRRLSHTQNISRNGVSIIFPLCIELMNWNNVLTSKIQVSRPMEASSFMRLWRELMRCSVPFRLLSHPPLPLPHKRIVREDRPLLSHLLNLRQT